MENPYRALGITDAAWTRMVGAEHVKPEASGNGDDSTCVTLAFHDGGVTIQDDKLTGADRQQRTQFYTSAEFAALAADIKAGKYDAYLPA